MSEDRLPTAIERQMNKRRRAVEFALEGMVNWYIRCNKGVGPTEIVELRKGDAMLRWCDPPLHGVENPMLVEFIDRGFWALRTERLGKVS